jgi:asparagine synthase (glutamine-hydrolysing)
VRLAKDISKKKLKTFSAGFEDTIDELPYAQEIATLAGTDHTSAQMSENLLTAFLNVTSYFDEPFADSSNVPTSLISKLAREKVKVALSGDGGDELFWGYGQYTRYNHLPKLQKLKSFLTGSNPFKFYKGLMLSNFTVKERKKLLKDPSIIETDPTIHIDLSEAKTPLEKINLTDFYMSLPGDMLTKVDRASSMHSLEVRSPFLNHTLAQFAYNLPSSYKTDGRRGKLILEKAFGDLLPPGFFTRKKQGFGAPVYEWLHKPAIRAYVREIFSEDSRIAGYLSMQEVNSYVASLYAGDKKVRFKVWALLSLETWMRTHE